MNDILRVTTDLLGGYGLTARPYEPPGRLDATRGDAWLRVGRGRHRVDYVVEIKRHLTRATIGAILAQARELARAAERPVLLVTDQLTPPLAETLKDQHQQFVDAAGNAYLECPGWLIWVLGRKLEPTPRPHPARVFTPTGLKILFVLLRDPTLTTRPYREIAAAAGVALGGIPAAMVDLEKEGHILIQGRRRRLVTTRRLLHDWTLGYARILRPRTLLRTLAATEITDWADWDVATDDALWGGEPAANLLVGHLRPGILTIYVRKIPARLVVAHRMTEPNTGANSANIEVRQRFWGEDTTPAQPNRTVAPVLVYADLLATGDARCLETAERVYEQYLARLFPGN